MTNHRNGAFSPKPCLNTRAHVFRTLVCLWAISLFFALKPSALHGAKEKTPRKEAAKANPKAPTPPVQRLTKADQASISQQQMAPSEGLERREHVVQRTSLGDTLPELLGRFGLPKTEKRLWTRSIQRNIGGGKLPAGKEVHFYFARIAPARRGPSQAVRLEALEVDYSDASTLTWERGARGIVFQKREKPYDIELKTVSASVESSLFEDAQKAGIHPTLLSQLADIFTWDVDFDKEIRPGDSFKIVYEQRSRRGQGAKASLRILAAELMSAGQKWTAVYFEKQKGLGNYYNLDGRSLARSFLRFPLEFTSITSHFAHARFHPLLKVSTPHTGIDFAAKRGTPVRAVGDGIITQSGWNGAYGKAIDIQHDATYTTRYAHLDRLAEGIRHGTSVVKGQVIGYVGSTGRTTGPHLHFELYKDQQYIDPLSVEFPAEETIEPAMQKPFDDQKHILLVELSSAPQS
jgi:murein DD-endopeptidase MepM/ murein hydrolase activator NlpD